MPQSGYRLNGWLSAAIIALMLLGTAGGAWWFGSGGSGPSDDGRMRLAAVTQNEGTPEAIWPEPLTPETDPWVAAITPDECTAEPMPYEEYAEAKTADPGELNRSYEIVGPANPEEAQEAVTILRGWMACGDTASESKFRSFYTDDFIFFQDFTVDNAPYREELDRIRSKVEPDWTLWAKETDLYPMSIIDGVEPPERALEIWEFAQQVLNGEEEVAPSDFTPLTYYEARFNPADAVMLDDGRMMIPTHYVYWVDDPWIQEFGVSPDPHMRTAAVVLKLVDGEWKIDESAIWICIGECEDVLNPAATPVATPIATPED